MKRIRITSIPPGFAPESIRVQWVGVTIPLVTEEEKAQDPPSGISIGAANRGGYMVLTSKAVEALEAADKTEAKEYWGGLVLGSYLVFKKECCEVVED